MQENRTRTNRAALAARRALGLARGSLAAAVSFTAVQEPHTWIPRHSPATATCHPSAQPSASFLACRQQRHKPPSGHSSQSTGRGTGIHSM